MRDKGERLPEEALKARPANTCQEIPGQVSENLLASFERSTGVGIPKGYHYWKYIACSLQKGLLVAPGKDNHSMVG